MWPILKSVTRGLSLFSNRNAEIGLTALKSVQMGLYLAELVLKGIHRFHMTDFEIGHQGAEFIK